MQNWGWPPTRTWNRTKRGWRPSNTNTTKHELASTSEEGAKKLQAGCKFYSELYAILGSGDAFNPDRMTISASSVIPGKSNSSEPAQNVVGETDGSVSPTVNLETSDSQPSTSTLDNSPPQPEETCEKNKSKKRSRQNPNWAEKKDAIKGWSRRRSLHERTDLWHVALVNGEAERMRREKYGAKALVDGFPLKMKWTFDISSYKFCSCWTLRFLLTEITFWC